jgi:hypothetical protein
MDGKVEHGLMFESTIYHYWRTLLVLAKTKSMIPGVMRFK